jgi:hypothetical protein
VRATRDDERKVFLDSASNNQSLVRIVSDLLYSEIARGTNFRAGCIWNSTLMHILYLALLARNPVAVIQGLHVGRSATSTLKAMYSVVC